MFGEKKDSTFSPNKFQGIEPAYMLQIFYFKILTLICSGDTKKLNLGGWGGKK